MSRTATINYLSQIVPLNKGVSIPSSWPLTSGTYTDATVLQSAFTNVSTNPRIITIDNGAFDTAGVKSINCYEIHDAPTTTVNANSVFEISNIEAGPSVNSILNRLYPYDTDLESYLTVSASTRSNRISLEGQGALSSMISSGSFDTDYDYFVLIHADDAKKHHLAKITELHTYEVFGDGFDFTPAFEGDIPRNTKISIYKGPASTDTHIVAVGYGLLGDGDDSDGRHDTYVELSRPTFYFYEDRCEKNRLDSNTKYKVIKNIAYEVSTNLHLDFGKKMSGSVSDTGTTPDFQKHGTSVCFLTTSDFGGYIVDKTAYSQFGELVDNLKTRDKLINTGTTTTTTIVSNVTGDNNSWPSSAETSSANVSFGEWDKCFYNTMRDTHTTNGASAANYDSPVKRIITYEDSDLKNYNLSQVQYIDLFDSVASIGNYMEMKFPDANKILNLKLNNFDNVLVRKEIKSEDYSGGMNIQLSGVVSSSTTGWTLTFSKLSVEQDFRDIWGTNLSTTENTNKLRVGNYIFAGDFTSAPTIGDDGYEQVFTITHYRNILTDNTWTTTASNWNITPIVNGNAFVYPFMSKEKVIVGSFDIDTKYDGANIKRNGNTIVGSDNFISNTEILIRDKELTGFTFKLNYGDKNMKYVKPTITSYDGYQIRERIARTLGSTDTVENVPELYSYINGDMLHLDNVFDGYIESIKSNIQGGIVSYDITGRDYTNRLLDSVVNRNYTHSKDYIFTTVSPEANLISPEGTWYIQDFDMGSTYINIASTDRNIYDDAPFAEGDVIYCTIDSKVKLIGIVSSMLAQIGGSNGWTYWDESTSTHATFTSGLFGYQVTLTEPTIYSSFSKGYGATDLKYSRKSTSLGKALSVNLDDNVFPTHLAGCSNKGIVYVSGEKINLATGAYDSDLIEASANKSKFSIGYPMSKIEGNKSDTNFADYQFSISSNIEETNIIQNDTISSITEFAIANRQTLENSQALITLAPIFPVVLAKSSSNTSDTRISNNNGLYFVNTQGLSNGGFLHLLNSETNSLGASITFANPGYKDFTTGVDSIDYRFEDNFGSFIWRYVGLQKGNLLWDNEYLDKVWEIKNTEPNKMYGYNTGVNGYAVAQRIDYDGTPVSFGTENAFTYHYQKLGSPESRTGFYPVVGSRFWDIDKMSYELATANLRYSYESGETFEFRSNKLRSSYPNVSRRNGFKTNYGYLDKGRRAFESMDGNVENFYLFSTGDIYPDSYKRTNSIGYTNRNLQKYSLVIKSEGSESTNTISHESYNGSLSSKLINDSTFEILPIESANINTSELKRFGLARLVEVTYDWHFNEIDFENLLSNPITNTRAYNDTHIMGGIVEHYPSQINPIAIYGGEPSITGFGIDGRDGQVGMTEGTPYFIVDTAPQTTNGGDHHVDIQRLYTDFEVFNTGSSNKFGDYQPEEIVTTVTQDIYTDDYSNPLSKRDGSWFEVTGMISSTELVGRITAGDEDSGRTAGTYTGVSTTNTSASSGLEGHGLEVDVVVDSSGIVTSIVPTTTASSIIAGKTVKNRGGYYENGDVISLAAANIGGGSTDCEFTLQTADLSDESRIYVQYESGFLDNIEGTTTKKYDYTGRVKIINNEGSTLNDLGLGGRNRITNEANITNPLTVVHSDYQNYANLGFILGSIQKNRDNVFYGNHSNAYLGSNELTEGDPTASDGEKQYGYEFFLPVYFNQGGASRSNKYDTFSNPLQYNTINKSFKLSQSRVFDKLGQWDETASHVNGGSPPTPSNTTNRVGVGPSHLYTDMYGVVRSFYRDNHSKVMAYSNKITVTDQRREGGTLFGIDDIDTVYYTGVTEQSVNLNAYEGATIPNLHLSFLETDSSHAWISVKYGYNFQSTDYSGDFNQFPHNFDEVTLPAEFSTELRNGLFSVGQGTTNEEYYQTDSMLAMEFYLKPILNTEAENVSILELDSLTQTTDIPSSTTVKSNTKTNGRAIIKITTEDITLNTNNGKDTAGTGIAAFPKINQWIDFVNDLTGHYLVSEQSGNNRPKTNNSYPTNIHKIISHTINTTGATMTHYLEIDNVVYVSGSANTSKYYRVMRIAKDCLYDSTPKNIDLNKLSKQYTKNPSSDKCYTEIGRINHAPINGQVISRDGSTNEGVLSMYVVLDVDGKPNSNYVVRRSLDSIVTENGDDNSFVAGNSYSCLMTDGLNDVLNNITFNRTSSSNTLIFKTMRDMKGVVSIGETFNITTFNSPNSFSVNRCNLASALDVVEEVDEIVNHILEENNVQYNTDYDTNTDMYFIGPNYSGISGFHAINNLLGLKNKKFIVDGETIQGRDILSDGLYTNIVLSENDESEGVVNLSVDTSSYDFYNEVIVYGDNARGIARNNQSIRDLGRKITLEITDLTLQTSKSAQDKANKELEIVQILSSQVSFNVAKTRIPYLRAGQVITLDYPSLDVPTGYYQVLEIEDNFGQLPRITVGKYTQSLASRFADLSLKTREIEGVQRGNRFQQGNTLIQEAVIPEIKELNLKIIKTGTPSSTLGFSNTLGFSSELGFETSASLVEEVIYNEDLTE